MLCVLPRGPLGLSLSPRGRFFFIPPKIKTPGLKSRGLEALHTVLTRRQWDCSKTPLSPVKAFGNFILNPL